MKLSIGIDYGTNSARAVVVDCADGSELGCGIFNYRRGVQGIIGSKSDANVARQSPFDYVDALEIAVKKAIGEAKLARPEIAKEDFVGIGIDTTGSTLLPVLKDNTPLAFLPEFSDNPDAQAWLWKDHTSFREADEITELAERIRPQYLKRCGGKYSSEWWWSKILHCLKTDREVFEKAYSWVEISDWIPSVLAGIKDVSAIKRNRCAAGHKALYSEEWGGLPDVEFLSKLAPELAELRGRLYSDTLTIGDLAGKLSLEWSQKLGLPEGIPIAVGALDVHAGAVGCGIGDGVLIRVVGTSACDCFVVPKTCGMPEIGGICGVVDGSILPDFYGIEAGQSAVGDIYKWWIEVVLGGGKDLYDKLGSECALMRAGESGLLALDWNNGNRSVISDQRLTGLILGQTLLTTQAEIYRALMEATAFGARVIMERFSGSGLKKVIYCGGIAEKNPATMQIFADVAKMEIAVSESKQACALGVAIAAAYTAGVYPSILEAQRAMGGKIKCSYLPDPKSSAVYDRLYSLYLKLHDSFGGVAQSDMGSVMKELLEIKDEVRNNS